MTRAEHNALKQAESQNPEKFKLIIRSARIKLASEAPEVPGIQNALEQDGLCHTYVAVYRKQVTRGTYGGIEAQTMPLTKKQFIAHRKLFEGDDNDEALALWDAAVKSGRGVTNAGTDNVRVFYKPPAAFKGGCVRRSENVITGRDEKIADHEALTGLQGEMSFEGFDLDQHMMSQFKDIGGDSFGAHNHSGRSALMITGDASELDLGELTCMIWEHSYVFSWRCDTAYTCV